MGLLQNFLGLTNFRNPLLRTLVPSVSAAFAIQTAFAVPSILAQSDRFYDASGAMTFLSVTLLSMYLPSLRTRSAAALKGTDIKLPSLMSAFTGGGASGGFNWRQVALGAAVAFWSIRLGSYLFQRVLQTGSDSRFDKIKKSPAKFLVAWIAQATWVSLCLMPVIAISAIPPAAFSALPRLKPTDVLGLALYVGGFAFEMVADRQKSKWMQERREKVHEEQFITRGLWSKSQYPNYFGECTLWTGIATTAAGVLVTRPAQVGLGLSGGLPGQMLALGLSSISPAFVTFLLLKVSGVPLSEKKYDKRYGDRKDYQEWKKNTPKFFPRL
ncbi:uncharacterized protein BCR38DRAFT_487125 [Pseudomassariella vexata]|uniref:Uncharacterized protein n=1 Tax=Pseudomassariella vexata TaxID=1141098 RepID=A0A1Y2DRQ6_9PEZI|nr:uncharacterized protein BCR38DRAFT_487125 [Pseudomassariella vexata]ORY61375.1 hypothetical protein BCR38DRAFT_487125 [Pseudomassariella vexata]